MACNCAHCKHPLVAKNNPNNKKITHFAHKSGKECDGAIENLLHFSAKLRLGCIDANRRNLKMKSEIDTSCVSTQRQKTVL